MQANVAVIYRLHKLIKSPHEFLELPLREQAYVIYAVKRHIQHEKEEAAKIRNTAGKG